MSTDIRKRILMGIPGPAYKLRNPSIFQPIIERHRIGCDGKGVSTLVLTRSCHMMCKHCPNYNLVSHESRYFSQNMYGYESDAVLNCHRQFDAEKLVKQIQEDELYFKMTGGGVVFGGGEPLLYVREIRDFNKLCPSWWTLRIETSLNVKPSDFVSVADVFDEWIVDIKNLDNDIYKAYTGYANSCLLKNLKLLAERGLQNKVLIRIPLINGYNDLADIEHSKSTLMELGFSRFDVFKYVEEQEYIENHENSQLKERDKCQYLRSVRLQAAEICGIRFTPGECTKMHSSAGLQCNGHCLGCDQELHNLSQMIIDSGISIEKLNLE